MIYLRAFDPRVRSLGCSLYSMMSGFLKSMK